VVDFIVLETGEDQTKMAKGPIKQAVHKIGDYTLYKGPFPYRAREDVTSISPNTLITPSKNVINNTAGRLALVKGYTLDGAASTAIDSGIVSNFDFTNFRGNIRNLRCGFQTSALYSAWVSQVAGTLGLINQI